MGFRVFRKRLRLIQQMEAAECGIACLAMVLEYHGYGCSLGELRELCGTSRDGNSAFDLVEGAKVLGLEGTGLAVEVEEIAGLETPAILHWDLNHFVVLESFGRRGAVVVDPASGRRRLPLRELTAHFSGVAVEFEPTEGLAKRRRESLSYKRYLELLCTLKGPAAIVAVSGLLGQLIAVAFPAASRFLIDEVIQPQRHDWLIWVFGVLSALALLKVLLAHLGAKTEASLQSLLSFRLALELGMKILRLPIPFVESRSHGDLLERVEMQQQLQVLMARLIRALFDLVLVGLLAVLMLSYDALLGALGLGLALLRVVMVYGLRELSRQKAAAELAARGREQAALVEATSSAELIKALSLERNVLSRYNKRVIERAAWGIESSRMQAGLTEFIGIVGGVMHGCILWVGGQQVFAGAMTVGTFAGFLAIRCMLDAPMDSLTELLDSTLRFRGALERSDDVMSVRSASAGTRVANSGCPRIELLDVGFRYGSGGDWVFRNVSLSVEPGEHVAIWGASGHGKSTLAKLICGVLEPSEGSVLLDGVDIRSYDPTTLGRLFGVVLQEPLIMKGSLWEVLTLRNPAASASAVRAAATRAALDDVIARLPAGIESLLLSGGANLSGGERQRVGLAQALLDEPGLLVLDEATCSLDHDTERRILHQLRALRSTRISVAHRPSVVAYADRILLVRQGTVQWVTEVPQAVQGRALTSVPVSDRIDSSQSTTFPRSPWQHPH